MRQSQATVAEIIIYYEKSIREIRASRGLGCWVAPVTGQCAHPHTALHVYSLLTKAMYDVITD